MPSASRESAPAPDFESKGAIPKTTIGKTRLKVQQGPSSIDPSSYSPDDEAVRYCHCNQQSYGEMIMCDNRLCPMQWFHFLCVGIESAPKGNWFCELCRKDESRSHLMKTLDEFDVALKKWDDKRKYKE
ncbi:inhibitor of growth protein 1-like [Macrosteles quadrilineatus]|uniref:inhibitor of growth protein 1-like n=1 Tax=Macrosteles quadrilineatus TaxID=74068 RepID=UPI0023E30EFC|nr:inhibitor of growth protein 1-like [Macrosteles quadrilineatus]